MNWTRVAFKYPSDEDVAALGAIANNERAIFS